MDHDKTTRVQEIKQLLRQIESQRQSLLTELQLLLKPQIKSKNATNIASFPIVDVSKSVNTTDSSLSPTNTASNFIGEKAFHKVPATPEEKIKLFIKLFSCRADVFPRYWENNHTGKKGYSPVCSNEWRKGICLKPKVKCSNCLQQAFVQFTSDPVKAHLTGITAIGSYAINEHDSCKFLVADFDKSTWKQDIAAYSQTAAEMDIQVAVEISKSGNGAHAWIFFHELLPARKARQLGDLILSKSMEAEITLNLDSYDRFFPNQDLLPSGGFGNLIALPLQKKYRSNGNCVFVDEQFNIFSNQWEYLAQLHCLKNDDVAILLHEFITTNSHLNEHDEIAVAESILKKTSNHISENYSGMIELTLKGQVGIPLRDLPGKILHRLKKIATFANPKYFETQRMRFSTWNIPKYIFCGDNDSENIYIPRGLLPNVKELLTKRGFTLTNKDSRNKNNELQVSFSGTLFDYQSSAVRQMMNHEYGVLVAPTGTGKTIMAIQMIVLRKSSTLILVHRSTLIDQWIQSLCQFIPEIEKKNIGVLGSGRKKLKGTIDIAMLQSIANKEDLEQLTSRYDFLIVDECHRVPTVTFEPVLKNIKARFVLGLTATPQRKDRFQSIIFMQCGSIQHTVSDINLVNQERKVYFRSINIPDAGNDHSIQELWNIIVQSETRNRQIIQDIQHLLSLGKSPVVLSDRTEHIDMLAQALKDKDSITEIFVLKGELGKRDRLHIINSVNEHLSERKSFCLFATSSLIGEGFDIPNLDTMLITMPISFKGRLTQYVGRLHRQTSTKQKEIIVYDYVDTCSGMTISMLKKRIPAYKKLGYQLIYDSPI